MCQFFSAIVTRQGTVRFCEDDSHETIIARLGFDDTRPLATRGWIRVECVRPHDAVRVDETSVPGWYAEDPARYDDAVIVVAMCVAQARAVCEATVAPAWAVCEATVAQARAVYEATLRTIEGHVPPILDPRDEP